MRRAGNIDGNQNDVVQKLRKAGMSLSCQYCGRKYHRKPSYIARFGSSYCSRVCMSLGYAQRMVGADNPNYSNAGKKICENCGGEFKSFNKTRRFCSKSCAGKRAENRAQLQQMVLLPRRTRRRKTYNWGDCVICGGVLKTRKAKACGHVCANELRRQAWRNKPVNRTPNHRCDYCNTEFHSFTKTRIYCSYLCALKSGSSVRAGQSAVRSRLKYGAKKDINHQAVMNTLRSRGVMIRDLSGLGCGVPDCIAFVLGQWRLIEIKNPETAYGRRGLNNIQRNWISGWQGGGVYIVKSIEDAERMSNGDFEAIEVVKSGGFLSQ